MSTIRELADRLHAEMLEADPFSATAMGVPGYDHRVPDASEAGDAAWRSKVEAVLAQARRLDGTEPAGSADATTLACVITYAEQELDALDTAEVEYTVTAQPFQGPAVFFATVARTSLPDGAAAADYLARLTAAPAWMDQVTDRLRRGAAKGRYPVAPLAADAISWAERILSERIPAALSSPQPPDAMEGSGQWSQERDTIAAEQVAPALARWVQQLRELLPYSRPADQPGLLHIPGGDANYARAICTHTTLAIPAEELHQTGLDHVAALEDRSLELAQCIGLADLAEIHEALRSSGRLRSPEDAMTAARQAVARAEADAASFFPAPLPAPCDVRPMPPVVAASGVAPHYTPPRLDGTRPGVFWFNTELPTAGSGWELEGVAFHEAVPGHHLQLSRLQMLDGLPDLQRHRHLTVFAEGWGLYAEQLADEMGLYSGTEALLGAAAASLMRAARLVVDTGLHALGWTRQEALDYFRAHVPLPDEFLGAEIDRYIVMPGQALAYLTGKLEILRAREAAAARLGSAFTLPGFHAALLDQGSLPMPVMRRVMDGWAG